MKKNINVGENNEDGSGDSKILDSCFCLNKFHRFLDKGFYYLGYSIAKYPKYFIVFPFLLALLCGTGIQTMTYIRDTEYLFTPKNAQSFYERNISEFYFPARYSSSFDPSRVSRLGSFVRLLLSANDNQTMFRTKVWKSVMNVDKAIENLTLQYQDEVYSYEDICAKWDSQCLENPILELDELMPSIENRSTWVNYPIMLFPLIVPSFYGGAKINETEGIVLSVKSIALSYWFKYGTQDEKERSELFVRKVMQLFDEDKFEGLNVDRFSSYSVSDEADKNAMVIVDYIAPTVVLMVIVTALCMFSSDWVRCKIQVGLMGLFTIGLALGCSFGLLMYCRVPFVGINLASPFLILGVGLDDMFVLTSAWNRTNIRSRVEDRMAQTYRESAVSITITSVTNTLAFLLGAISGIPCVVIFCIYTGISIFVTYLYFLTFFGGCFAMAGFQEQQQRHAITNMVVKSKSEAESLGRCYSMWCAGGINKNDPLNSEDNQPPIVMTFFKEKYSKFLNNSKTKVLVIVLFLLYWAASFYGCIQLKEGLEYRNMVHKDSYLISYFDHNDEMYRKFPHRIQVILNDNITYSNPETEEKIMNLHSTFENMSYIASSLYTESWIRRFYKYLERRPHLKEEITDEVSFIRILKTKFLVPESSEILDVVFNEDDSQILASRFIIQSYEILTTVDETGMMTELRKAASEAPFDVTVYHPLFTIFDQFLELRSITVQTVILVAVAMIIVSFVFIPNLICSLCVTFSIVSIIVGVMGFMYFLGVSLDGISIINIIMCIGFSVDFSAHISYAFLISKADSPSEKVQHCMHTLGFPILQSGLTTFAGVLVFIIIPSYAYHTFFKLVFLVVFFGTLHALFLLPVVLSLLSSIGCRNKVSKK